MLITFIGCKKLIHYRASARAPARARARARLIVMMMSESFDHEKLDVYKLAIEFVITCERLIESLPRGRRYIAEQLKRAHLSIALNIAEGAVEFSGAEKAKFYRMARRSATECAAILDIYKVLELAEPELQKCGRKQLLRIVSMLVRMITNLGEH